MLATKGQQDDKESGGHQKPKIWELNSGVFRISHRGANSCGLQHTIWSILPEKGMKV